MLKRLHCQRNNGLTPPRIYLLKQLHFKGRQRVSYAR